MPPTLAQNVVTLRLDEIVASPLNPRRHSLAQFKPDALQALADSLKASGNLELITVRPHPSKPGLYELGNGERRWRAAQLAGIGTLEARVLDLADAQMLDLMLGGGANQEPLSAMAEAHGYQERMDLDGLSQQELADQLGLSQTIIAKRIALLELPESGQKAVDEGRLDKETAYLIATVPDRAMRSAFAAEVMHPELQDQPLTTRAAKALRQAKYCRSLHGVSFDTKDALLVPTVGSCTVCRFKEGNQCANIPCFESKVEASRERVVAGYRKQGIEPLTAEENAKAFPHGEDGLSYKMDLVEYAKPVPEYLLKAEVTPPKWADICHGPKARLQVRVGFDQVGRPVELVRIAEAVSAADLNERSIFNEETRVRFGLENQSRRGEHKEAKKQSAETGQLQKNVDRALGEVDAPAGDKFGKQPIKDRALAWMLDLLKSYAAEMPHEFRRPGWHIVEEAGLMPSGACICEGCDKFVPDEETAMDQDGLKFCAECEEASRQEMAEIVKARGLGMSLEQLCETYGWEMEDLCGALGETVPEASK